MATKKTGNRGTLTPEHKAALVEGRAQGKAVRQYLEALESTKRPRGRPRSKESMEQKLAAITEELATADPLKRLHLIQQQLDLKNALKKTQKPTVDISQLEKEFIESAAPYAARKGLSYGAFRSVGVPAAVLSKAGISRG